MKITKKIAVFAILAASFCWSMNAKPVLPAIFSDNMVLQQQTQIPIWGQAGKRKEVKLTASWDGKTYIAPTDSEGNWKIEIQTPNAGGPYDISISDGKEIKLSNVMIGEVWICSGQSNMEMPIKGWGKVMNFQQEINQANHPDIRLYQVKKTISPIPLTKGESTMGGWQNCSSQTVENFSAVAYFFARALHLDKKVPVGIIHTSWSGTICEAWISAEMLYTIPAFKNRVIEEIYKSDEDWAALHQVGVEKDREREKIVQTTQVGLKQGAHKLSFNDKAWKEEAYPVYPPRVGLGGGTG